MVGIAVVVSHLRIIPRDPLPPVGHTILVGVEISGTCLLRICLEATTVVLMVDLTLNTRATARVGISAVERLSLSSLIGNSAPTLLSTFLYASFGLSMVAYEGK